ncbi:hypothetical protein BCR44DRAFT_75389 [Catenaria anguillulae PL171]|uniref:Uncharacterized protein n=1 Tax=Catenaria anguillulae PL171 TaxID=765915 RepID=A0A1Y2HZE3_9FUNG|nr:hypothetical protein BCR44DRAFT_75389 [Catenaria anguillulae PL171]
MTMQIPALANRIEFLLYAPDAKSRAIDSTPLVVYMVEHQVDPTLVFAQLPTTLRPGPDILIRFFDSIYSPQTRHQWTAPDDLFRFLDHMVAVPDDHDHDSDSPEWQFTVAALHYLLTDCLGPAASMLDPIMHSFTPTQFTVFAALALVCAAYCEKEPLDYACFVTPFEKLTALVCAKATDPDCARQLASQYQPSLLPPRLYSALSRLVVNNCEAFAEVAGIDQFIPRTRSTLLLLDRRFVVESMTWSAWTLTDLWQQFTPDEIGVQLTSVGDAFDCFKAVLDRTPAAAIDRWNRMPAWIVDSDE